MNDAELCLIKEYDDHLSERLQVHEIAVTGIYTAMARFKNVGNVAVQFPLTVGDIVTINEGKAVLNIERLDEDLRKIGKGSHIPMVDGICYPVTKEIGFPLRRKGSGESITGTVADFYLRNATDPIDAGLKEVLTSLDYQPLEFIST